MSSFGSALKEALSLLAHGDPELVGIILRSLRVSGIALLLSASIGIPIGAWMGLHHFRGRWTLTAILYTGMGFPPVVVGLFVYLMLSRSGPLGDFGWLFTTRAMIVAQTIIALPLIAAFTMASVGSVNPQLRYQLLSLGATRRQATLAILLEARLGVVAAVIAGFGGIISEVGAVMLVGGNIEGKTRVLTTAVLLETRKGNYELALALGFVLIALTFFANLLLLRLQGVRRVR
ncbi:MAG: ABC transporter permease [Candidatus Bipolaricaulia bacterium]